MISCASLIDGGLDPARSSKPWRSTTSGTRCDVFRPLYDATEGGDGFVSLEVSPLLAGDTAGTVAAAKRLWAAVDRPNLMIKIPGTKAGLPAIAERSKPASTST